MTVFISLLVTSLLAADTPPAPAPPADQPTVVLVVGAQGEEEYGSNFLRQATLWKEACAKTGTRPVTLGLESESGGATNDLERLKQILAEQPKDGFGPLWLILIGHGTFDGHEARFNLRGPDLPASDLALWLKPFQCPLAVINTTSSSAPFLNKLSATNRVVITATRSGHEQSFTRFGQYLAEAIATTEADLDKDGQVSLLEAFLIASGQVEEFYKVEGRLASEHALIDDNGDGLGTPSDWFRGLRATKTPSGQTAVDGFLSRQFHLVPSEADRKLSPQQRAQRDALERAVLLHRAKKNVLPEDEYYRQLEKLLLDLARFYESFPTT